MMTQSQMNKVHVYGIDLHYLDLGNGDPVVMIHGGGATDYRTWASVIDRFAEKYRVIVPSLRYHYPNEWVGDGSDYTSETHARDIAALIETLGLAPAHIVGSSLGSIIALVLTRERPELVRSLVLGEPVFFAWLQKNASDTFPTMAVFRQAALEGKYEEAARRFADGVIGPGAFDRMPELDRQKMVDNARLLTLPEEAYNRAHSTFSREDARAITTPTLLLRGDSSPKLFLMANDELAKEMPEAERAQIPHASHLLQGMNPQVYSDTVLSFLARH